MSDASEANLRWMTRLHAEAVDGEVTWTSEDILGLQEAMFEPAGLGRVVPWEWHDPVDGVVGRVNGVRIRFRGDR